MAHLSTGLALTPGQIPLSQGKTPSVAAEAAELGQNRPGQNRASFSCEDLVPLLDHCSQVLMSPLGTINRH